MWFTELLKQFFASKVNKNEIRSLPFYIDLLFEKYKTMHLESILTLLSYMARIYKEKDAEHSSIKQVVNDLRAGIIVAEKITSDYDVPWVADFVPQLGNNISRLVELEANFLNNKIHWDIDFRADDIIYLLSCVNDPNITAEFKVHALHEKLQCPDQSQHLIDEIIYNPLLTKILTQSKEKQLNAFTEAAKIINDKKSFEDLSTLPIPEGLLQSLKDNFLKYTKRRQIIFFGSCHTTGHTHEKIDLAKSIIEELDLAVEDEIFTMEDLFSVLIEANADHRAIEMKYRGDSLFKKSSYFDMKLVKCFQCFERYLPQPQQMIIADIPKVLQNAMF